MDSDQAPCESEAAHREESRAAYPPLTAQPRMLAGQYFVENDSKREQVAPRIGFLPGICSGDM